jgi:hypothetical protein
MLDRRTPGVVLKFTADGNHQTNTDVVMLDRRRQGGRSMTVAEFDRRRRKVLPATGTGRRGCGLPVLKRRRKKWGGLVGDVNRGEDDNDGRLG